MGVRAIEPALIQGYTDPFDEDIFTDRLAGSMRRTAEAAGISCVAFSAHIDIGAPDGDEQLRRRIRFASQLGARRVVTNAAKTEFQETFFQRIDGLAREAEAAGVVIALENPGDGRPNIIDNAAAARAFITKYDNPWIRLNYDPGNLLTHQPHLDPVTDAQDLGPGLVSMHLKNASLQGDRMRFTALHRGSIDYAAVLAHTDGLDPVPEYCVELPIRVSRAPGGKPFRDSELVPLETIHEALDASLSWLTGT
ncbi:MAG: TIM barrel protein [Spirochaeta sp.]|nr:TIM barrel protein [Spirochaeta sp.]